MVISGKGASEWGILTEAREEQAPRDKGKEHPLVDFFFFFFFLAHQEPTKKKEGLEEEQRQGEESKGKAFAFRRWPHRIGRFFLRHFIFPFENCPATIRKGTGRREQGQGEAQGEGLASALRLGVASSHWLASFPATIFFPLGPIPPSFCSPSAP